MKLSRKLGLRAMAVVVATSLVAIYKALGGGWEIRDEIDVVPPEVREVMAKRTNWGNLLDPAVYVPSSGEERRPDIRLPDR